MLTFMLSFPSFEALVAGGSNASRYPLAVRRPEIAERGAGPKENAVDHESSADKGFDNARFTYYADGLGACGQFNGPGDFVSAELLSILLSCSYSSIFLSLRSWLSIHLLVLLNSGPRGGHRYSPLFSVI